MDWGTFKSALHAKNVSQSTLLHTYKTTNKCIQFVNKNRQSLLKYDCLLSNIKLGTHYWKMIFFIN